MKMVNVEEYSFQGLTIKIGRYFKAVNFMEDDSGANIYWRKAYSRENNITRR